MMFRCDNAKGEYNNVEFKSCLADISKGVIQYEPAPPHWQNMNGVSERMMRTIGEMARSSLADSGLDSPQMWKKHLTRV